MKNFKIADIKAESRYTVALIDNWDGSSETKTMTGKELVEFTQACNHLYDIHAEEIEEKAEENIAKEFETLNALMEVSHRLDDLWDAEPENENLESAWDATYKAYWHQLDKVAGMISEYSGIGKRKVWAMMAKANTREAIETIFKGVA